MRQAGIVIISTLWISLSTIMTLYSIFGSDIATISFERDDETIFDGLTLFALGFFTTEIATTCIVEPRYPLSFFFYLDLVATLTLPFDLSFVAIWFSNSFISAASHASRAGTGATRILRVIRLIRLFRIPLLLRSFRSRKHEQIAQRQNECSDHESISDTSSLADHKTERSRTIHESDIGKRLADLASKRVVLLVLSMMILLPQLEPSSHFTIHAPIDQAGIDHLHLVYAYIVYQCRRGGSLGGVRREYESRLINYVAALSPNIAPGDEKSRIAWIAFAVSDTTLHTDPCLLDTNSPWLSLTKPSDLPASLQEIYERLSFNNTPQICREGTGISLSRDIICPSRDLRWSDVTYISSSLGETDGFVFQVALDQRDRNRDDAFLSIYRTLCICVILGIGTYMFSNRTFSLVLEPIVGMMQKVEQIRTNPLEAIHMHEKSTGRHEANFLTALAKYNTARTFLGRWLAKQEIAKIYYKNKETEMLERTIVKIGSLLAVGFGPAGAEIVARNIASTTEGLNVFLPGKRVEAIFGCIRIHDFGTIAGILKRRVMLFVNHISDIVHGVVDEFHGFTNRSDGDSFQLIWKLTPEMTEAEKAQVHDMALAACVKITVAIGRSLALNEYRNMPPLVLQIPKFRVRVSFGLHRGWAVEGAIGSMMKIDPSYLSADVNVAESVQRLNKNYRTSCILVSDAVRNGCSKSMRGLLRLVDKVRLESRRSDLSIYSLDLDMNQNLLTGYELQNRLITTQTNYTQSRKRAIAEKELRKTRKLTTDMYRFLQEDRYFLLMRKVFDDNPLWFGMFQAGVLNLFVGETETALRALRTCQQISYNAENRSETPISDYYDDGVSEYLVELHQGSIEGFTHDFHGPERN